MATNKPTGDPRVEPQETAEEGVEQSVRPIVARRRRSLPTWVFGLIAVAAGLLLFTILDARRRSLTAPAVRERAADQLAMAAPPPPLFIPPEAPPAPVVVEQAPAPAPAPPPPPQPPQIVYVPQPTVPQPPAPEVPPAPQRTANAPALVFDGPAQAAPAEAGATAEAELPAAAGGTAVAGSRTRAGVLANRSTTVAQGTLIPAVLETALDSTRPGLARAIVSRDVRGFDGTRVLIPRGSRLIGEYQSQNAPGQKRALINWIRLIRPDGVTIAIGSPAGDTLGRGGVRAQVNNHFFERFAGAILQSALDIGVNLAGRASSNGTVVVLPGTVQGATQIVQPAQITPTLRVRPGTSISIFVARDLDFTGAGGRR